MISIDSVQKAPLSFLKEFRDFAMRGNVLDMAIGVVVGTAFSAIVSSLVGDVIMPLVGMVVGNIDMKDLAVVLQEKTDTTEAVVLKYGAFMQTIIDFILIAFSIFVAMKLINRLKRQIVSEDKQEQAAAPDPKEVLLGEIRDLLKQQAGAK
ncbi:MAG: large-conductance mechanosensitive channel protein MscL [Succinivibrionaceae bacterium]|nr:large-conductance mechanosensitive channel protein MscL [Succinivibrionaceae bacterium]